MNIKFVFKLYLLSGRSSNVKMLLDLGCCICFTNKSKTETLNSKSGQTALYWIIMNTPDCVIDLYFTIINHLFKVFINSIKAEEVLDQLCEQNAYQTRDKYYLAPLEAKPDKKDCKFVPKSAVSFLYVPYSLV